MFKHSHLHKKTSAGFTIIEVLVATAILSVALTVIFQSISTGAIVSNKSQKYIAAILTAESLMDRIGNDLPLRNSKETGKTDLDFRWKSVIRPYKDRIKTQSHANATLHDISLEVFWEENGKNRSINLYSAKIHLPE
ncbi:MAG: prepilin-type N-terminal cleavage/methylation domain-containing protein [Sneathiella sp.]